MIEGFNKEMLTAKHLVIDLETLGLQADSHILSIGAAGIDMISGEIEAFYRVMPRSINGMIDLKTVLWWMTQPSQQARGEFSTAIDQKATVHSILTELSSFFKAQSFDFIWGNSNTFDLEMLKDRFKSYGVECPWTYRQERDFRTLRGLLEKAHKFQAEIKEEFKHVALEDAIYEVKCLQETLLFLSKSNPEGDLIKA